MEAILVHPKNSEQSKALKAFLKAFKVPFESQDEVSFSKVSKADIDKAYNEMRNGEYAVVNTEDLWK